MKTKNYVINIGRQFGSGGHEIGKRLAQRLNISFYDKELISLASQKSGLSKEFFEKADEKAGLPLAGGLIGLRSTFMGDEYIDNYLGNESLFKIQSDVIREVSQNESAVFVGRCADYILRDHPHAVNVFVSADITHRIRKVAERNGLSAKKAKELIDKTDKKRASYYNYYSNKRWGSAESYHLCLNSIIGIDSCVDVIEQYLKIKCKLDK